MKIALVTATYRPRVNGVAVSVETFYRELVKLGHEVTVVAPAFPHTGDEPDDHIVRIPSHYLFFDPEDRLPNPWLPSARRIIRQEVLSRQFDVIHTQTPFTLGLAALGWARESGAILTHTYHTMFESYLHYVRVFPRSLSVRVVRGFSRWYCQKMNLVVAPSCQMKDLLVSYGVSRDIAVIPTGFNTDIFHPVDSGDFRSGYGIESDVPLLFFAGRIAQEKNIPFLFDVLCRVHHTHPRARLFIAGDGPARKGLEKLVRVRGLADRVIFAGYLAQADLARAYAAADIFTFASVTETQGLVVIEAMATGTPVVAIGRMGVVDVMSKGKGGYMVEPLEADFTEKVLALLDSKELMAQKRQEALEYSHEWSAEGTARKLLAAFEEALARRKKD